MARHTEYRDEYAALARNYCLLGAIDEELAEFFGVTARTIRNWKREQPAFAAAIVEGSKHANAKVTGKLYDNCMAGDTTAIIWWQKNRMGWRDRVDTIAKIGIDPIDDLLGAVAGSRLTPKGD